MTRDHWAKMLPFIRAFVNRKQLEARISPGDEWRPIYSPVFTGKPSNYRIKPRKPKK